MEKENIFDVAIIGGGPGGMMSAIRASDLGAKVILLEKNKKLGRKLLLTGNGRCNITNATFDLKNLVSSYGKKGKFLFPLFTRFGPKDVVDFFEKEKLKIKIERGKRVFPKSNKAESVLKVFLKVLKRNGVVVLCNSKVHRLSLKNNKIRKIVLDNKKEIFAKNYIIATGGFAYPMTGSTGDGIRWSKTVGHKVEKEHPVLVPLKIKEPWVKELQGLGLKNIEIEVVSGKKKIKRFGELLFTHYGVTGPIILDISKEVGGMLKEEVKIFLDLKPRLDYKKLDERLQRDFQKYSNKLFKNGLDDLLPKKMILIVIKMTNIDENKKINEITRDERKTLLNLLKRMEMTVDDLMGFDLAITSCGGVSLDEIDNKTMRSKKISNLFFAGEIIDIDGPTGGFNLQLCWSTGYVAGESAIK
jgi:predicted Rossmann fold flavoprotein